jgi:hypothetical protein
MRSFKKLRIYHLVDLRQLSQMSREPLCIRALFLHPESQRLNTAKYGMSLPRTQHSASQCQCTEQCRLIKILFRNDDAASRVSVPAEILRRTVNDKVGSEI